jgi:hypothetical protein
MATYKFLGASGGPLDFYLSIDDGMGMFRLLASVTSGDNVSIISPDLRAGAISTAFGRINAPIAGASYQFMVHCLDAAADGSPLFLKVVDETTRALC